MMKMMKEDQFLFFMKVESSNSKYQTKTLYINNSETFFRSISSTCLAISSYNFTRRDIKFEIQHLQSIIKKFTRGIFEKMTTKKVIDVFIMKNKQKAQFFADPEKNPCNFFLRSIFKKCSCKSLDNTLNMLYPPARFSAPKTEGGDRPRSCPTI